MVFNTLRYFFFYCAIALITLVPAGFGLRLLPSLGESDPQTILLIFAVMTLGLFAWCMIIGGMLWRVVAMRYTFTLSRMETYLLAGSSILPPVFFGSYVGSFFGHDNLFAISLAAITGLIIGFCLALSAKRTQDSLDDSTRLSDPSA